MLGLQRGGKPMTKLTDDQISAPNQFGGVNRPVGAVWFEGRWLFRQDLRDDPALAEIRQ